MPRPQASHKKSDHSAKPREKKDVNPGTYTVKPVVYVLVILLLTFIVFLPVFSSDFMYTWDDSSYITDNVLIRSLNFSSLKQMFFTQIGGTYVPLPLISYAIEYKLFGLSPVAYHSTNLLIHLFCTLLVFEILRRLGLQPLFAAIGALIFGIHPMGVESVAWVTERKDLLYTFFYLSSIIAYLIYLKRERHHYIYIGLSWVLFLLALFSKIQAVSLPLILLLIDFYMGRPVKLNVIAEKIPFLVLSLIFGIAGIFILKNVGALKINALYAFHERLFFGSYAFSAYLIKFFAPLTLSALYPYPVKTGEALPVIYYLSPILILILAFAVYKSYYKVRAVVFGILFFTLSVFFLLQIFGAGQGFMADRYTKVPYVGMVFIAAWWIQHYLEQHNDRKILIFTALSIYLVFFMVLSFQRARVWKNGETLWSDMLEKYPDKDSHPYACRGLYYKKNDEPEKALKDFGRDLELDPNDIDILQARGNIYFSKGKDDSAYSDYIRALKIRQDNALTFANLGAIYVRRNQNDSALYNLTKALSIDSTLFTSYANRAVVYSNMGQTGKSIEDFRRYLKSKPDDERVIFSIGMIYFNKGEFKECLSWFNRAIAIKPDFANYYWMRSQAFRQTGNKQEALSDAAKAQGLGFAVPGDYLKTLK